MRKLLLPVIVALAWMVSFHGALAQSNDDALARSFFESGRAYFDRAEYDEAAHAFAEAYRLSHRPALLLNQARALEEANRTAEAVAILEQAGRELPASEEALRSEASQRLSRLRLELEREQRLQRDAATIPTADQPTEGATTPAAEQEHGPRPMFVLGLVSGGVGAAMLGTALGTGLAANAVQDRLDANCPGNVCPAEFADDVTHGQRLARTSTAMTFIGIGALGAAIPLVILGLRDPDDDEPRVSVTAGPGLVGSGLSVRF